MADTTNTGKPAHRWLWFIGLWATGVLTVAALSYGLRWLILG